MKENKEELINIGQEQINKAVELFEGKAIDALDFLTWQFKNDFASDIDYKLKGYKKDFEELNQKCCQLIRENEQLKSEQKQQLENAIVPKFKVGDDVWGISNSGILFNCKVIQHPLIEYKVDDPMYCGWHYEHQLFATEQEARDRLEELKNGKD